jgi:hypothetical protein
MRPLLNRQAQRLPKAAADVGIEALPEAAGCKNIEMAQDLIAKPFTLWPIMGYGRGAFSAGLIPLAQKTR